MASINWTHKLCSIRIVVAQCAMHVKSEIYFYFFSAFIETFFCVSFFHFHFFFSLKCESTIRHFYFSFFHLFRHFGVLASLMWMKVCVSSPRIYVATHPIHTRISIMVGVLEINGSMKYSSHAHSEPKTEQSFMQNWKLNKRKFIVYRNRFPGEYVCACVSVFTLKEQNSKRMNKSQPGLQWSALAKLSVEWESVVVSAAAVVYWSTFNFIYIYIFKMVWCIYRQSGHVAIA